jgi:hypothetical protein
LQIHPLLVVYTKKSQRVHWQEAATVCVIVCGKGTADAALQAIYGVSDFGG